MNEFDISEKPGLRQADHSSGIGVVLLHQPIDRASLVDLLTTLEPLHSEDLVQHLPDPIQERPRIVAFPWRAPAAEELDAQRAALQQAAERLGIENAWFFEVPTLLRSGPEDAGWSNGSPPQQSELPFPVDGYAQAVKKFDGDDLGLAIKLKGAKVPGEEGVLRAFLLLWIGCQVEAFRNADVTIDPVHRAAHFWVDRYSAPLSAQQSIRFLMWIVGRLHEVLPVLHATFQVADMGRKYGAMLGDERVPFIVAGNPYLQTLQDQGPEAAERWRQEQTDWSTEEVARMVQQAAIAAGRDEMALELIQRALRLSPRDDDIQYAFGRITIAHNQLDTLLAALPSFESATLLSLINVLGAEQSPAFGDALEWLLEGSLPTKIYGEGRAACGGGAAIRSFGDRSGRMLNELVGHVVGLRPQRLDAVLALLPDDVDTLSGVGYQLVQGACGAQALAVFQRIAALPPPQHGTRERANYCRAINNACVEAHRQGDYRLAVQFADQAQALAHENPHIYHSAACAYAASGDLDRAFEQVRLAVECDYVNLAEETGKSSSSHLETDQDLGELLHQDRFKDLFARWRGVRRAFISGTDALRTGNARAAAPLLEQATGSDSPLARMALINLGLAQAKMRNANAMWKTSMDAHQRFPEDADAFANLVMAGRMRGRLKELVPIALAAYQALRPDPRSIENVIFVLNECGRHRQSREAIEWWVARHGPLHHRALGNAVNAYLESGQTEQALDFARQLTQASGSAFSYWHLSTALLAAGDLTGALEAAKDCFHRDPSVIDDFAADPDMEQLVAHPSFAELVSEVRADAARTRMS